MPWSPRSAEAGSRFTKRPLTDGSCRGSRSSLGRCSLKSLPSFFIFYPASQTTIAAAAVDHSNLMEMHPLLWKGHRRWKPDQQKNILKLLNWNHYLTAIFPRKSGAGVVVRRPDGSVIAQLREGLGSVTDNTAEYRALLLGLRYAAKKGFKYIRAQGDSSNVCNQAQGLWTPKSAHMVDFCKKVKQLKGEFLQIQITLVSRKLNADAAAQAKTATKLPVGEIQEQSNITC